jgi:hypothetical protein
MADCATQWGEHQAQAGEAVDLDVVLRLHVLVAFDPDGQQRAVAVGRPLALVEELALAHRIRPQGAAQGEQGREQRWWKARRRQSLR